MNCFGDDSLQHTTDDLPEDSFVPAVEAIAGTIPPGEETGGLPEDTAVSGVMAEGGSQLDTEKRQGGVGATQVDVAPELADLREGQGGGIEAVLTGVLVAELAAARSSGFTYRDHNGYNSTFVLICQGVGDRDCWQRLIIDTHPLYPPLTQFLLIMDGNSIE